MAEPTGSSADFADTGDDSEQVDDVGALPADKQVRTKPKKKAIKQEKDLVKLAIVSDSASGIILFKQIYHWSDAVRTAGLGKLIESFYKFASDIDDGIINSIFFETPMTSSKLHRRTQSRPTASSSSSSSSSKTARSLNTETMRLVCRKDSGVISAAFFDTMGNNCRVSSYLNEKHKQFVTNLSQSFLSTYSNMLPGINPTLMKLNSDSKIDAEEAHDQISHLFLNFQGQVDGIRDSVFPGPLSIGSVVSLRSPLSPVSEDGDYK